MSALQEIERIVSDINPKDQYTGHNLPQLAGRLNQLKSSLEVLKAAQTTIQKEYDKLAELIVPERMEEEDVEVMRVKGVGRLQTSSDIRCSVPKDNRLAVQKWLHENGHGSMVAPSVNSSTFKAFVKEAMKEGTPYPQDLIKVSPYTRATVVKG